MNREQQRNRLNNETDRTSARSIAYDDSSRRLDRSWPHHIVETDETGGVSRAGKNWAAKSPIFQRRNRRLDERNSGQPRRGLKRKTRPARQGNAQTGPVPFNKCLHTPNRRNPQAVQKSVNGGWFQSGSSNIRRYQAWNSRCGLLERQRLSGNEGATRRNAVTGSKFP